MNFLPEGLKVRPYRSGVHRLVLRQPALPAEARPAGGVAAAERPRAAGGLPVARTAHFTPGDPNTSPSRRSVGVMGKAAALVGPSYRLSELFNWLIGHAR